MVAGTNGTFIFYDTIAKISIGQFALKVNAYTFCVIMSML